MVYAYPEPYLIYDLNPNPTTHIDVVEPYLTTLTLLQIPPCHDQPQTNPSKTDQGVLVLVTLIAAATVSFNVFNALVHHTNDSREQTMVRDVHPRTRRRTTPRTAAATTLRRYEMRSGSSFAAEIFNQHPGAFYVFEPLWAVSFLSNGTYNSDACRRDMLTALMTCRFEGLEKFLWFYLNDENFYVFTKSEALLNVCKKFSKPGNIAEPCPIPRSVLASVLGRSCHAKNFTVIKTIRVKDIDLIRSTLENIGNKVDLKIIHLVRDPRATIASRMGVFDQGKSYADLNVKNKNYGIYGLCREALRNMQPKSGTSSFLRDRYALVRYEDIIRDITEMAKRLYNFTGVPIHRDVLRWIQLNTNVEDVDAGPFSRKRNAKEAANHWRTRLSFSQVRTIQDYCVEAMRLLGYRFITDDAMLKNMSASLLGELNQDVMAPIPLSGALMALSLRPEIGQNAERALMLSHPWRSRRSHGDGMTRFHTIAEVTALKALKTFIALSSCSHRALMATLALSPRSGQFHFAETAP
ncbi:hypothetical protein Bbelb_230130 [Branchiostoma belcheri]|nr:hypothetical protein Bbelb_230130 [Branchiostoma belcheri]